MAIHSNLILARSDGRPMYLQIVEQIRQRVAVGDWPRGEEIPSIRQLAAALRISVITVKRAYQELESEGVIVTQQGKGSTVGSATGLSARLHARELTRHLREAARLGVLIGLNRQELVNRLRDVADHMNEDEK